MREIKFRGYAVEEMVESQWLYGAGVTKLEFNEQYADEVGRKGDCFLFTDSGWVQVHESSVGQYTGINDKNSVEIYEGDVVQDIVGQTYVIAYDEEYAAFILIWVTNDERFELFNPSRQLTVIGNRYENPDLAEGAY
ncbi:YopX family protein [Exiguobacterium sp. MMG028]|uniref:YopX family protein n=1 Tax=Exiguobacterium sp. MMG028 TaxID=3021979 RepID=UPI0022FF100D|nr:YopX family protein [Exiguobacterium sp. MMG028]MDA5561975.1 YopX family protein [Exiguobacterium sp. MMG028]